MTRSKRTLQMVLLAPLLLLLLQCSQAGGASSFGLRGLLRESRQLSEHYHPLMLADSAGNSTTSTGKHNHTGTVSKNCTFFNFGQKYYNYSYCTQLDELGHFRLWWTTNHTTNITKVAFQGAAEVPYTWAGWGISPDGTGKMKGSTAFVGYSNFGSKSVQVTARTFFLATDGPGSTFIVNPSGGAVSVVNNGFAVGVFASGFAFKTVALYKGLLSGPQTVIWRGGASVVDYAKAQLGTHTDLARAYKVVDFSGRA